MNRRVQEVAFGLLIRWTLYAVLAFMFFAALFGVATVAFGEITGPESVEPGYLAVYESTIAGDFVVYPKAVDCFAKDTNGKRIYFATPRSGEYSVIFFGLDGGKPAISTKDFIVGNPLPTPSPVVSELTASEKSALKTAADSVLKGIRTGLVKQPNHARMEFKRIVILQMNGEVTEAVQSFLKIKTEANEIATLDDLKVTFEKMREELQ